MDEHRRRRQRVPLLLVGQRTDYRDAFRVGHLRHDIAGEDELNGWTSSLPVRREERAQLVDALLGIKPTDVQRERTVDAESLSSAFGLGLGRCLDTDTGDEIGRSVELEPVADELPLLLGQEDQRFGKSE